MMEWEMEGCGGVGCGHVGAGQGEGTHLRKGFCEGEHDWPVDGLRGMWAGPPISVAARNEDGVQLTANMRGAQVCVAEGTATARLCCAHVY